ncbi:MAG: hypothetical protein KKH94_13915 [Candidatus Omnitrophica bacterium]|nr:hypothetical protein [Candidatus Omnitrophota bacterium]
MLIIKTNIEKSLYDEESKKEEDNDKFLTYLHKDTIQSLKDNLKKIQRLKEQYYTLRERNKHKIDVRLRIAHDWNEYWKSWFSYLWDTPSDKTEKEHQSEMRIKINEIEKRFEKLLSD